MEQADNPLAVPGGAVDPSAVWRLLAGRLRPTLLHATASLDRALGARVVLCAETLQHTGSFKYRAALSAALHSPAPRLLCASSGNFGAALARAASEVGKGCTVIMPAQSAAVKIDAVRGHGATVDLIDTARITRQARVAELAAADPAAQVLSPYDDPYVIAGNSSLGAEIFADRAAEVEAALGGPPNQVVVPVGGGGLASGWVVARNRLAPGCAVVGAEPLLCNDAARSLRAGSLQRNDREGDTLCDGARTLSLGQRNYALLREGLAGIVEVADEQVAAAVRLLFGACNLKAEPTGALAVAAVLTDPARFAGRRVVCVVSGGNVDAALYASLLVGG